MIRIGFRWTDEIKAKARKLYVDDQWSASMVAAEIGHGVTRNAVIGIAHRCGWKRAGCKELHARNTREAMAKRTSGAQPRLRLKRKDAGLNHKPRTSRPPGPPRVKAEPKPIPPAPDSRNLPIEHPEWGGCRFITTDPGLYCCAATGEGKTYCDHHHAVVYQGKPLRPLNFYARIGRPWRAAA